MWGWAPDRPRATLNAKYGHPSTDYRQVAGTTLRVRDTGLKDAPAVILLHGFGSSLETWESWAVALGAEHRVVRFDFPGSGLSDPDPDGDYGDARSLSLLSALMDQLGIRSAALVGNSLGGRIAWEFAADYPDRVTRLVLISPDGFASPGFEYGKAPRVPSVLQLMKFFLPESLLRANLEAAYADPQRLSATTLDRYYDLLLATGNREAMIARMRQTVLKDPVPTLKRIITPTLLVWGEKDGMIPYGNSADYLRALPHARLVSLPNLGHVPFEESPAACLPPVAEFLRQPL